MDWSSPDSLLSRLLSGSPFAIAIGLIIAISLPLLLHAFFYHSAPSASSGTPTFLLLGPSGAGKTSLLTLFQRRSFPELESSTDISSDLSSPPQTRTSQGPLSATLTLPAAIPLGSNRYRSANDPTLSSTSKISTKYILIDTPGHGKLRLTQALTHLSNPSLRGIIFIVDAAALDSASPTTSLRDTASYLHNTLLELQRRKTNNRSRKSKSKPAQEIPVLIAANKQDLFTALPAGAVRSRLEAEIDRVRKSRSHGLTTVSDQSFTKGESEMTTAAAEDELLGGDGEAPFTFGLLADEFDVRVDVVGGAVKGDEAESDIDATGGVGKGTRRWEEWIGGCL